MIKMDGKTYNGLRVLSLERKAQVLDDENTGRNKAGVMKRSIIGTYYNYSVEIDHNEKNLAEYDEFYDKITAPVESHKLVMPYGQSTYTFDAYVTAATDNVVYMRNGKTKWNGLKVDFVAMKPKRRG